jgi:hypothetical protein
VSTDGRQQPAFYLNNLAPPQPPKRFPTWGILTIAGSVLAAAIVVFVLAALPEETEPQSPPGVATPVQALPDQTRSATPTRPGDSAGRQACDEVRKAIASGVTDPAVLADWAKLAVAARGAPDEKTTRDKLAESARTLQDRCTTYGYYRP